MLKYIKNIRYNKFIPLIFALVNSVIGFLTSIFIARPLGTELYGQLHYYLSIITLFSLICGLGTGSYITKNIQFSDNKKEFVFKYIVLVSAFAIMASPVFFVYCYYFSYELERNVVLITVIIFGSLMTALNLIISSYYIGIRKPSVSKLLTNFLPRMLIFIFAIVFVVILGFRSEYVDLYLFIYIFAYALSVVPTILIVFSRFSFKFNKAEIISMSVFYGINIFYNVNSNIGKIIQADYYSNSEYVGIFSLCLQVISIVIIFSSTVLTIVRPTFASLSNDNVKLKEFFLKVCRVNSYITIPLIIAVIMQSNNIMLFFGDEFAQGSVVIIILGVNTLIDTVTGPSGTVLLMCGYEKYELINGISNVLVFIACSFAFASFGLLAIPLALLTSGSIINIMKCIELMILKKQNFYSGKLLLRYIFTIATSCLCFYGVSFVTNTIIWFIVNILVGLTLIAVFIFIKPHSDDISLIFHKNRDMKL